MCTILSTVLDKKKREGIKRLGCIRLCTAVTATGNQIFQEQYVHVHIMCGSLELADFGHVYTTNLHRCTVVDVTIQTMVG